MGRFPFAVPLSVLSMLSMHAAVLGTSLPAPSLTPARIATLPAAMRRPWLEYLDRSTRQLQLDHAALAAERAHLQGPPPVLPKEGFGGRAMPADREPAFYATAEATRVADTILSFQIPNGGWSKNLDMAGPARLPGQSYAANNLSRYPGTDDFDAPRDPAWNYVGTLDNDATNTEIHFLVRVAAAHPGAEGERFRSSVLRGLHYLLDAQYPNGGWPQVWPLEGGYHDAITFNDNAVTESAATLAEAANGAGDYAFVPPPLRRQSRAAADRAVALIVRAQVVIDGRPTIWPQQSDPLTLTPVAGRNFEPAALSAGESADILVFLMSLANPSPPVRAAIEAGVAWLREHEIHGETWTGNRNTPATPQNPGGGRHLEAAAADAVPLWPRYTSLQTGKPVFGDRDKTIHDNVTDLSFERRNGYAWYSSGPQQALDAYVQWRSKHGS